MVGEMQFSRGWEEKPTLWAGGGEGQQSTYSSLSPPPAEGGSRGVVEVGRRKELKSKENLKVE